MKHLENKNDFLGWPSSDPSEYPCIYMGRYHDSTEDWVNGLCDIYNVDFDCVCKSDISINYLYYQIETFYIQIADTYVLEFMRYIKKMKVLKP